MREGPDAESGGDASEATAAVAIDLSQGVAHERSTELKFATSEPPADMEALAVGIGPCIPCGRGVDGWSEAFFVLFHSAKSSSGGPSVASKLSVNYRNDL